MYMCFEPQRKFDTIAYSNLVIDLAEIVPHNVRTNPQFPANFLVFESLRNQLDDP